MANRIVLDVDARGRVSLARVGLKDMQVVAEKHPGGRVTIHPAVVLTEAEASHYQDPESQHRLEGALREIEDGKVREMKLRTDPSV